MPRTFTFTPTDQDQIFAITVIRDELTVVNVSDGNTKLQLSISTTRGGSPIIQIPSTGGKFDLRPSLLESLDEGMTYRHNIWDYSNSVDGKRIATGTFTHAESIKSVDIAYPTVTLADGTLRIFVTQAQYDGIDPKLPNAEYVIFDAATTPGEGTAPSAASALADQTYTQNTGDKTVNAADDFINATGGAWSVSGVDATISAAGVVTIPTSSLRSGVTITVTYTNSGGSASSAFSVTVTAAAVAPTASGALPDRSYTQSTGAKTVNAAPDFQNAANGTWSVSGAGATISTAGVVTLSTDTLRNAVTVTVTYTNASGSASSAFSVTVAAVAVIPGGQATAVALAPDLHYHINTATLQDFSSAVPANGGRVASMVDRQGLANATQADSAVAPILETDGVGRKNLVFRRGGWMAIADALNGLSGRDITVLVVARTHRPAAMEYFYPRYNGAVGTANTLRVGALVNRSLNGGHGFISTGNGNLTSGAYADATNRKWMIPPPSVAVLGMRSNSNNVRYRLNGKSAISSGTASLGTGRFGGIIGGTPSGTGVSTGDLDNGMTLYEMVIYRRALSDAEFDAAANALQSNWGIIDFDRQVVVEGDSISQGIIKSAPSNNGVYSNVNLSMLMTEPGAGRVPASTRVLNIARGGARVGYSGDPDTNTVYFRQNDPDNVYIEKMPVSNKVLLQICANDFIDTDTSVIFSRYKALFTASGGFFPKGWEVSAMTNIFQGSSGTTQTKTVEMRNLLMNNLLSEIGAGSGGAYQNWASVKSLHLAQDAGQTRFEDSEDADNITYYLGSDTTPGVTDRLHPSATGALLMATGGDTPQHGYVTASVSADPAPV